jgi:hypothetical protein
MGKEWKLPRADSIQITIELGVPETSGATAGTKFDNWKTTIQLVYLEPSKCSVGSGWWNAKWWEYIVFAAFINNQMLGSQIVEFEPYLEYEADDGSRGSFSEAMIDSIPPSRTAGTTRLSPTYREWQVSTPVPLENITKLVVGVRSGGTDWNQTLIG